MTTTALLIAVALPSIGYMLFCMMVGMVVAAPLGGLLTDRIGARRAALLGLWC